MKMNVYLAARFSRKAEMRAVAERLEARGTYQVVSRWIDGHECADADCTVAELARFAAEDREDIYAADGLIAFTETPDSGYQSGGRHVEFGIALERDLWVAIIGPPENIFHYLDLAVEHFDSLDQFLAVYP